MATQTKGETKGDAPVSRNKTNYIVLQGVKQENGSTGWVPLAQAEGLNDVDAIKAAAAAANVEAGEFVAIPARSFRTRKIEVQTRTSLRIL